jgi:hypothetical protein
LLPIGQSEESHAALAEGQHEPDERAVDYEQHDLR